MSEPALKSPRHFDRRIDPAELGIRSESKAFEFQLPLSIDD
jgi:hypothetical protein